MHISHVSFAQGHFQGEITPLVFEFYRGEIQDFISILITLLTCKAVFNDLFLCILRFFCFPNQFIFLFSAKTILVLLLPKCIITHVSTLKLICQ